MLSRDEFNQFTQEIALGTSDEARISSILCDIHEAYDEALSEIENIVQKNKELEASNSSLKEANYNLFLKIGQKSQEQAATVTDVVKAKPSDYLKDIGEYK